MRNLKKTLTTMLAVIMLVSISAPAFAADTTSQSTPVEVTAAAATFNVTVPTTLPISVSATGVVTTASDAKIVNNSWGAIKVSGLAITGQNGWSIANFDTTNMSTAKVNAKLIAMSINGDKTTGVDAISFNAVNFPKLDGMNDTATDELAITYTAKVPAQSTAIASTAIAQVVFTIEWDAVV